jgi:hypothetical protein
VIFFARGSPGSPRSGSDVCTHRERFLRKITTKCQNCNHMLKSTAGTIIEQVLKLLSRHWDHISMVRLQTMYQTCFGNSENDQCSKNVTPLVKCMYLSSLVHSMKVQMKKVSTDVTFSIIVDSLLVKQLMQQK